MIRNYSIDLNWDEGRGVYRATVRRLDGCFAEHSSSNQAVRFARRAIREWIKDAEARGEAVPPPEDHQALIAARKPRIAIYWSDEDDVFIAEAPDLPGCMTHGGSYRFALNNLMEAMGLWLSAEAERRNDGE